MTSTQQHDERHFICLKDVWERMLLPDDVVQPGWPQQGRTDYRGRSSQRTIKEPIDMNDLRLIQRFSRADLGKGTSTTLNFDVERYSKSKELDRDLDAVFQECSQENWDGYDAAPISNETYLEAKRFIGMICSLTSPLPEISPEPGGEIGFEWYKEKKNLVTVSVTGEKIIYYAGLFGENNETCGKEQFGSSIPKVILDSIERLFPST